MRNVMRNEMQNSIYILADFKTVKKKFATDQNIEVDLVDTYLDEFKELRNRNKIKDHDEKNIDFWGKKSWEEFKEFVDTLKTEKTKTEEKKLQKQEGAELIAENKDWSVYKITTHKAAMQYGFGTKWCITQSDGYFWNKYIKRSDFYFLISKTKPESDKFYKIALQVRRYNIYWDAKDKAHNILPSAIKSKLPKFDAPIPEKSLIETPESLAEAIDDEISMYVEGYDLSEYEYAAWPDEIDVRESSLGVEEGEKVDRIEELCNALEINFGEFVKKNLCEISYDYDDTYTVVNFPLGEINGNISEDFLDKFSSFNSDEQLTVKKHMVNVVDNWETGDFTVLTDAAIYIQLQPDRFDDAIKELESNIKIENEKDASKIDKMAAKSKYLSTRLKALSLTKNQDVLEKALKSKNEKVAEVAASRITNKKILKNLLLSEKVLMYVKEAALTNKNFTDQTVLKQLLTKRIFRSDWSIISKITDTEWLKKYTLDGKDHQDQNELIFSYLVKNKADHEYLISYMKDPIHTLSINDIVQIKEWGGEKTLKKLANEDITNNTKEQIIDHITDEAFLEKLKNKEIKAKDDTKRDLISAIGERISHLSAVANATKMLSLFDSLVEKMIDDAVTNNPNAEYWDTAIWEYYDYYGGVPDIFKYFHKKFDIPENVNIHKLFDGVLPSLNIAGELRKRLLKIIKNKGFEYGFDENKYYLSGSDKYPTLSKLRIWREGRPEPDEPISYESVNFLEESKATSELVTADFKTVKKKFATDQNIEVDLVDTYLDEFKELRDRNKITKIEEKNIDFWGKKSWEDFKKFVDKTKEEKSATEEKKLKKIAGAELMAENEGWYVYQITTHEACMLYGSGTKWCITQPDGEHWKEYSLLNNIYFIISKNLSKEDTIYYKIAVTVDTHGYDVFWDSLDNEHSSIPPELEIPSVRFTKFNLNEKPEEFQLEAVKKKGSTIKYIENPSEAVQLEAINQNSHSIEWIKNPSEAVQLEAVKLNGDVLYTIKNPSEAVQIEAIIQNPLSIQYIQNVSEDVKLAVVKRNGFAIKHIENPSEAVQIGAVKCNGNVIDHIKNPSEAVQLEAVKQNGLAIKYIENPSEAVQLEAVKQNGLAIRHIENPSEAVKLEAVRNYGFAIKHIENPSEAVQLEAVKRYGDAIQYIENPTEKVKQYFKDHKPFSKLVTADFKTVEKKFIKLGIDKDLVQTYIEEFKELRDKNRIASISDKNIDNWGKKPWDEFKEFIDDLKKEVSKTQEKKLKKMEGAELVAENDDWYVYHITTHDACKIYGSGTKWCITQPDGRHWKSYTRRLNFYFIISKKLDEKDKFYKIAMQVNRGGGKKYWDATDQSHARVPTSLNVPKFNALSFESDLSPIEAIRSEIESFEEDRRTEMTDVEGDNAQYVYEQELDLKEHVDDEVQKRLKVLEKLCEKLDEDFEQIVKDVSNVELTGMYYQHNEIASNHIGSNEYEMTDEIREMIEALTDEEREELGVEPDSMIYVGNDYDRFVLIIDEDKLEEKIKELGENLKAEQSTDERLIDKLALSGKNISTRIKALNKTNKQDILEKSCKDENKEIRKTAVSRITNTALLDEIVVDKKENEEVRLAAMKNPNFDNQEILKSIANERGGGDNEDDPRVWNLYTTAITRIEDIDWLKKYALQKDIKGHIRSLLAIKAKDDTRFIKDLISTMITEDQSWSLAPVVGLLPDNEQELLKKIAYLPRASEYRHDKRVQEVAVEKITDEKFLMGWLQDMLKEMKTHHEFMYYAEAGLKNITDQNFLQKTLEDDSYAEVHDTIIAKIEDKKFLVDWVCSDKGKTNADEVSKYVDDQDLLARIILDPKIWGFHKAYAINKLDLDGIQKILKKIPTIKMEDIKRVLTDIQERLNKIVQDNPDKKDIIDKYTTTINKLLKKEADSKE